MAEDPIKEFASSVAWGTYRSASFGMLAVQREGKLYNLRTRIVLDTSAPKRKLEIKGIGHGLVVCRGRGPLGAIRQALDGGALPSAMLGRQEVLLRATEDDRPYHWTAHRTAEQSRQSIGWPGSAITGAGESLWKTIGGVGELQRLEELLPALKPDRFTSWSQIVELLGLGAEINESTSSFIEIFAPTFGRLRQPEVDLRSGVVTVAIECRIDPKALRMEVVFAPELFPRRVTTVPASQWRRGRRAGTWLVKSPTRASDGRVAVHLIASERRVWREMTTAPPIAVRVQSVLDPGERWLRDLLFPTQRTKGCQDDFEQGVVALFGLGGFSTVHYGHRSRDRYPDAIVHVGEAAFLVVECSVESPTARKLANLAARAAHLSERSADHDERPTAFPVVAIPVPEHDVPREVLLEAGRLGVKIFARAKLEELLVQISAGQGPTLSSLGFVGRTSRPRRDSLARGPLG